MEVRIQYLRRHLTTAFLERDTTGYKGPRAMWIIELVLQESLSERGSSSRDRATHTDYDLWKAEFYNRFLEIFFVLARGIHLSRA